MRDLVCQIMSGLLFNELSHMGCSVIRTWVSGLLFAFLSSSSPYILLYLRALYEPQLLPYDCKELHDQW